jgi:LPS export ABC transporter permease LptG
MNALRPRISRFLTPALLAAGGAALCAFLVPREMRAVEEQLLGFPDSHVSSQKVRPLVIAAVCLLPAIGSLLYALGGMLDRYITRQFAGIFGVCLSALVMIWLLVDINDNLSEFRDSKNVLLTIAHFYLARSPAILLLLLPYSMLLALIYSLGKLSRDREIVAMIQSGRGVLRITRPMIIAGVWSSLFCLGLNYHWAPAAEGNKDAILMAARGLPVSEAADVLFLNPDQRRLWMVGSFPVNYEKGAPLLDVDITTTHENHSLRSRLSAKRALWDRESRHWTFEQAVIGRHQPGEPTVFQTPLVPVVRKGWSETPWQLIKPGLSAEYLGIPALNAWLSGAGHHLASADPAPYRTQWHYRLALPFTCLVTVLLATPLSIHFSRRGAGGSVFIAVVLSALMLLLSSVTLALGESATIPAPLAAWLPNILFCLLGLYLYQRRIAGRPIYQVLRRLTPGGE